MNKSSQHTPGPWKAHEIIENNGPAYSPVSAKTLLAKVYSEAYGNHAESQANARLIAAAPELLEALEKLVFIRENLFVIPNDAAGAQNRVRTAEAYSFARAALATAKTVK